MLGGTSVLYFSKSSRVLSGGWWTGQNSSGVVICIDYISNSCMHRFICDLPTVLISMNYFIGGSIDKF